jgi:hypothetical protein
MWLSSDRNMLLARSSIGSWDNGLVVMVEVVHGIVDDPGARNGNTFSTNVT